MKLHVDEDELAACVACGLCLPHCPTYRVTQDETRSPRGRIAAMRAVHWGGAEVDDDFVRVVDECVQCLGCVTACPSSVPFGRLMEGTRESIAERRVRWWERLGYRVLARHRLVLAGSSAMGVAQRARVLPRRVADRLPRRLPVVRRPLRSSGSDVWLYTGCVMDAWQRHVHRDVMAVLEAAGAGVAVSPGGCCGALHAHAGLVEDGRRLANSALESMPGDAPVLVDSAGCGAWLKDHDPTGRVRDVHEWVAERIDRLPVGRRLAVPVAVQDPCHLRHAQRAHLPVRTVLGRYADLVELDDEGLCCGAGGAYAAFQPELSEAIRDRKVAAIGRTGASVVASANPGCIAHLQGAGLDVRHPLELVAEALFS